MQLHLPDWPATRSRSESGTRHDPRMPGSATSMRSALVAVRSPHPGRHLRHGTPAPLIRNTLRFELLDTHGQLSHSTVYLPVGGGELVEASFSCTASSQAAGGPCSMRKLVRTCERAGMSLPEFALKSERTAFGTPAKR